MSMLKAPLKPALLLMARKDPTRRAIEDSERRGSIIYAQDIQSPTSTKILGVVAGLLGCFGLYYGTGMMLVVPGFPGEHYLSWGRVVYGLRQRF